MVTSLSAKMNYCTKDLRGKTLINVQDAIAVSREKNVKFIDGSWWLGKERDGRQDFETGPRISNARFLDIDSISTKTPDNLPHMIPSSHQQSIFMDAMDISETDHVIVYGGKDCMFISRAYWQIKSFHPRGLCHLLDGSLQDWIDANGPVEEKDQIPIYPVIELMDKKETTYNAINLQNLVDIDELKSLIEDGKTTDEESTVLLIDARSPARFSGEVAEPRKDLKQGHMPGAKNLFFLDLLDPENKNKFKPKDELRRIIQGAGIKLPLRPDSKIISSCGSGVTACCLLTAFDILDEDSSNTYLYDGSWVQWGSQEDTPIIKDE